PANQSTGVSITPFMNISVNDYNGDSMTITWYSNSSGFWVAFGTNSSVTNGTYHQTNNNFSDVGTIYWWSVNCNDGMSWTNETYLFTTESALVNNSPNFSGMNPSNESTGNSIGTAALSLMINDSENDTFNWTIETSPDIGNTSGTSEYNGTKTCVISGLSYSTTYYWFVNATDTGSCNWTNETYWFTTESEPEEEPPSSNPPPSNPGSTPPENSPPDAKTGGPYTAYVNQSIFFNGSKSTDDGTIVNYSWSFGDGTNGTGRYVNHTYGISGNYTVYLTVIDNNGASNTTKTYAYITFEESHDQSATPTDNSTIPETNSSFFVDELGYFIDMNDDGLYDVFVSNQTGNQTSVQRQENGNYLIDSDGDGTWDYRFDPASGLTSYQNTDVSKKTPGFEFLLTVFALIFAALRKRKRVC
ncbi:MAG: PKD domain-containing protein, partial [Euryarchaeota archaeon]|nr:PKD domain-containing protein [Euryarchaeota archaeon]